VGGDTLASGSVASSSLLIDDDTTRLRIRNGEEVQNSVDPIKRAQAVECEITRNLANWRYEL
jgi:hypothetical protein